MEVLGAAQYLKAYQQFRKLDRGDGKEDGKVERSKIPKAYQQLDNEGDGLTFMEFADSLNASGATHPDSMVQLMTTLRAGGWSEELCSELLVALAQDAKQGNRSLEESAASLLKAKASPKDFVDFLKKISLVKNAGQALAIEYLLNHKTIKTVGEIGRLWFFIRRFSNEEQVHFAFVFDWKITADDPRWEIIARIDNKAQIDLTWGLIYAGYLKRDGSNLAAYRDLILKAKESDFWRAGAFQAMLAGPKAEPKTLEELFNTLAFIQNENQCLFFIALFEKGSIKSAAQIKEWGKGIKLIPSQPPIGNHLVTWRDLGLIRDAQDLVSWVKALAWLKNEEQVAVLDALVSPLNGIITSADQIVLWQRALEGIQEEDVAGNTIFQIMRRKVKTPEDLIAYVKDFSLRKAQLRTVQIFTDVSTFNPREEEAYRRLDGLLRRKAAAFDVLYEIAQMNQADIPREDGFRGNQAVLDNALDLGEVLARLYKVYPDLDNLLVPELERQLGKLDGGDPRAVKQFFKSIPSRRILDRLLAGKQGGKAREILKNNWRAARSLLGHIFYGEDKITYSFHLKQSLSRQGFPRDQEISLQSGPRAFDSTVIVIDLTTMARTELPIHVEVLGKNQVRITMRRANGSVIEDVINPDDINSAKIFWLRALGKGKAYHVFYYPKITFSEDGKTYRVNMEYIARDGSPENLLLKTSNKEKTVDRALAREKFMKGYEAEDEYYEEALRVFARLPEAVKKQARAEAYLSIESIITMMKIMDTDSCDAEVPKGFGITKEQYLDYKKRVEALLGANTGMTPADFLLKAIEACDGRVMLAAVISYNILRNLGETRTNNLTLLYPDAFKKIPNIKDQAGPIYHFMGCFFAAYAVQRCLVHRYHSDRQFAATIDARLKELRSKFTVDFKAKAATGLEDADILLMVQYQFLQDGDESLREVLSLAGIFKEEVVEDADTSDEVLHDFRGIAAGQAFYEVISGTELTRKGEWLSRNDNRRNLFVEVLKGYLDKTSVKGLDKLRIGYLLWRLADGKAKAD